MAVELLPEAQWRAPNARLPSGAGAVAGDAVGAAEGGEGEEEEAAQEVAEVFQVWGAGPVLIHMPWARGHAHVSVSGVVSRSGEGGSPVVAHRRTGAHGRTGAEGRRQL